MFIFFITAPRDFLTLAKLQGDLDEQVDTTNSHLQVWSLVLYSLCMLLLIQAYNWLFGAEKFC